MIEMKNYNRQIERENDQLKESKAQAIKDRDHLMEKNRQLIRECKEKE
jgi:tRNA A37 threonylcarbamoyladenosine dehydratase